MRLTYLDEAGTSKHEPVAVVAGVIARGDQLVAVEDYLSGMVEEYIPAADRPRFAFHATELWSGKKYFEDWTVPTRCKILMRLAEIPCRFRLPIVHGTFDKTTHQELITPLSVRNQLFVHHACAFANAAQCTERFFRKISPSEYTVIIAEDQPDVRRKIKIAHEWLQGRPVPEDMPTDFFAEFEDLPFRHIRDTIHFAAKKESPLLQVADTCAFLLRGSLTRNEKFIPFFRALAPAVLGAQLN